MKLLRASVFLSFLSSLAAAQPPPVPLPFKVNSLADELDANPGDAVCETAPGNHVCTLRAAVMESNAQPLTVITVVTLPLGPYQLTRPPLDPDDDTGGDLDIRRWIEIRGSGGMPSIQGTGTDRLFEVAADAEAWLVGLDLRGGRGWRRGGAILNFGRLNIYDSSFDDNVAIAGLGMSQGGAIDNSAGPNGHLRVSNTTIVNCTSDVTGIGEAYDSKGGGINSTGRLEMTNDIVANCSAGTGGGICITTGAAAAIRRTLVYHNLAYDGGGIAVMGGVSVQISLVNSTVAGNNAVGSGGGLHGWMDLDSSTLVDNVADQDLDGDGDGGGIWSYSTAPAILRNTVVARNQESVWNGSSFQPIARDCGGKIWSFGASFVSVPDCTVDGPVLSGDAKLGTLQWNGGYLPMGPALTVAPLEGSPLIDAGYSYNCIDDYGDDLSQDMRGAFRPVNGACDIGAVERGAAGDVNGNGQVNVTDVLYLINDLFAGGPPPIGYWDVNGDDDITVVDVLYLINHLFAGGPAPVEPD